MSDSSDNIGVTDTPIPKKLKYGKTILLSLAFGIVLLVWYYFNIKVPRLLYQFFGDEDIWVGVIMAIDNIIAVIVQPYFGKVSDKSKSRFGRRMPFIVIGTFISAILFIFFPFMQWIWGLIGIIFLFDLAMAIFRSASVAIVPDNTPREKHAQASGLQQFIANLGGVMGFVILFIGDLLPSSLGEETLNKIGFGMVSGLMVVLLVILMIFSKEKSAHQVKSSTYDGKLMQVDPINHTSDVHDLDSTSHKQSFFAILVRDKKFVITLLFVFFTYLGFAAIETFFSSVAEEFLHKTEYSIFLLLYSISMILSAFFNGWLGQKIGRKKALKIGMSVLLVLFLVLILFSLPKARDGNDLFLIINFPLIGIFWMMVIVNTFPIIWTLAPPEQVGQYTGIYYTFNQLAYTLSPIMMGGILQLFGKYVFPHLPELRFIAVFPFVFVCTLIAFIFLLFMKGGE
ncbi:MAG: MFS transporter, partial [Promethearchaeota archaeon]